MLDFKNTLIKDLIVLEVDVPVTVTGVICKKWHNKYRFGIQIKDLTGTIAVSFSRDGGFDKSLFFIGKRIRVFAETSIDKEGKSYLSRVKRVEFLEDINELGQESDIAEQESIVINSEITNSIRRILSEKYRCIEITSRLISRYLGEEILEPMLATYPGFGTPAYLSPSPSSQLTEFLTITLLPRVFTSTVSFTTSHRFSNGESVETPIVMCKIVNLSEDEERRIVFDITNSIVEKYTRRNVTYEQGRFKWDGMMLANNVNIEGKFSFFKYESNIPVIGKRWNSLVRIIGRLEDDKGNLLSESAVEEVSNKTNITTITFYPTQYLNYISKAPKRQLLNLWKIYDGGKIYG